jgi:hypothetical protein
MNDCRAFTITKRIAKHGQQSIIVIPKMLEEHLKPGTIVELQIGILEDLSSDSMDLVERQ